MLTPPFRALALVQALVLVVLAGILLARAGVITTTIVAAGTLGWLTWVVLAFLVLNTAANLTAPHPLERWGMGSTTLILSGLTLLIALSPPPTSPATTPPHATTSDGDDRSRTPWSRRGDRTSRRSPVWSTSTPHASMPTTGNRARPRTTPRQPTSRSCAATGSTRAR